MFLHFSICKKMLFKNIINRCCLYPSIKCFGTHQIASVGFIGLGVMGSRMARNLLKQFKDVYVNDINKEAVDSLVKEGAKTLNDEDFKNLDCVITMLPTGDHVLRVYQEPTGLISKVRPFTLLIDSSTTDPKVPQMVAAEAEKHNISFLEAPVSGGQNAAAAGTLTFMVGGSEAVMEHGVSVLRAMGKNLIFCGPTGCGQLAKLCNNMLLAISMVGTAEAMNLGIRMGMDPKVMANVINVSSGRCWSSETYNPVPSIVPGTPACNDYKGGFAVRLITKDLVTAQSVAERSGTNIPLGIQALTTYKNLVDEGKANLDFSVVYQYLKERNI